MRKVEELVREMSHRKADKPDAEKEATVGGPANREISQLQSRLSSHFGTRVVVKSDGSKGEIKIPFLSVEDLNRIMDIFKMS